MMEVNLLTELMSLKAACAVEELFKDHALSPRAVSTAWFFKTVYKWLGLIWSRHPSMALSLFRPEKHEEAMAFLECFIDLFINLKIGDFRMKANADGSAD